MVVSLCVHDWVWVWCHIPSDVPNKQTRANWTEEQKAEYKRKHTMASAKRKGTPNTACYKSVTVNGVWYESVTAAANALGVCRLTLYNKVKRNEWTMIYD